MSKNNGNWKVLKTSSILDNGYVKVYTDEVIRPDGKQGTFSTVHMKPGVAVLPLDSQRNLYLVKQFRYVLGKQTLEAACGSIEGEEATKAAKRELEEELGIKAKYWKRLGIVDMDTSIIHCPSHLFLATGLTFTQVKHEPTEDIISMKVSPEEAFQMVMDSHITHGPSVALLLKAFNYLRIKKMPVKTETVEAVGYNAFSKTLRIWYNNKKIYDCYNIAQQAYNNLCKASSIETYLNKTIEPKHPEFKELKGQQAELLLHRDYDYLY